MASLSRCKECPKVRRAGVAKVLVDDLPLPTGIVVRVDGGTISATSERIRIADLVAASGVENASNRVCAKQLGREPELYVPSTHIARHCLPGALVIPYLRRYRCIRRRGSEELGQQHNRTVIGGAFASQDVREIGVILGNVVKSVAVQPRAGRHRSRRTRHREQPPFRLPPTSPGPEGGSSDWRRYGYAATVVPLRRRSATPRVTFINWVTIGGGRSSARVVMPTGPRVAETSIGSSTRSPAAMSSAATP